MGFPKGTSIPFAIFQLAAGFKLRSRIQWIDRPSVLVKVLIHSRFYPNVGGIESVADLLTREWHKAGIDIAVASDVRSLPAQARSYPFAVHYQPTPSQWLALLHWADIFVHINVSLKALWPWLIVGRPLLAIHEGCYFTSRAKERDWKENLKLLCARRLAENIAASRYVASQTALNCQVIPNPYDDAIFHRGNKNDDEPKRELVFVGRLVSDKGGDLLIHALARLGRNGLRPRLTVVGDGPERSTLERLVQSLALRDQVEFVGAQPAENVARSLRQHEILVVPSLWEEPFGVVALEGAACGCVVLGSDSGGLPEAIGPAGTTFRRGDLADLTRKLEHLLGHREEWPSYQRAAGRHLESHRPALIAERYLEIFARVGRRRSNKRGISRTGY